MVRFRSRRLIVVLAAVAALVGGLFISLSVAGRGGEHDESGEDDGGPAAPAEYLDQKFTSFQDVSQAQIAHRFLLL